MPNNLVLPSAASKTSSRASSKTSRNRGTPSLPHTPAIATLLLGKVSRVFAAFVSFHYLQDRVALPLYLFFVTLGAAATLLLLQRPWNGKRIGSKRGRRVFLAGGMLAGTLYLWTAGLRSAGPLRALLVDGAELPLVYIFAVLSRRELPEKRKTRGAICMVLAYVLLFWDASGHVPDVREIEHSRLGQRAEHMVDRIAGRGGSGWPVPNADPDADFDGDKGAAIDNEGNLHVANGDGLGGAGGMHEVDENGLVGGQRPGRRRLLTTFKPPVEGPGGVRDVLVEGTALRCEVGVFLLLVSSLLVQTGRGFSRRLATELGGAKRHFALSMGAATAWVTPLAALSWLSSSTGAVLSFQAIGGVTRMNITPGHALGFISVGFLLLVLPYYVRAITSTSLSQRTMMQSAVMVPFVIGTVASVVFGAGVSAGGVSWVLIAAFLLECVGVRLMLAGGVKRGLSELPIDVSGSTISRVGEDEGGMGVGLGTSVMANGTADIDANGSLGGLNGDRDDR